ncbi:MAG: toprim domain-containing protein [Desulfohalobiaceae bacterium]|nr:toprim domain-containing protein [Desulfohalobiaceae bacterium]
MGGHQLSDGSVMTHCPAHHDPNPSLHIGQAADRILLHCFAGCKNEEVIQKLKDRELWPNGSSSQVPELPPGIPKKWGKGNAAYTRHWSYHDIHGAILGFVVRYDEKDKKQVVPFFKKNGTKWKAGAATQPRPLYGQQKLGKSQLETSVLIAEGEKAADAAQRLLGSAYICISWPGGTNAVNKADWSPLEGRNVYISRDGDEAGRKAAESLARHCQKNGAKSVYIVEPPQDVTKGWDLADAEESGWTGEDVKNWIQNQAIEQKQEQEQEQEQEEEGCNSNNRRPTQSEILLQIVNSMGIELYEAEGFDTVYASFAVDDHRENWPVRSKPFKRWISSLFYSVERKPPGSQAIQDSLNVLEAQAQFEAEPCPVYTRIAQHQNAIYLDLCDQSWRAIEITAKGWRIVSDPPVRFRRAQGMLPLPEPIRGGSLFDIRHLLNMNKDQLILAISWLVGGMNPFGPFPILLLVGEQGTAKSTVTRILRSVIDPSSAPIRTYPREDEDLMIAAQNNWILAYDNLSGMPTWLSDALCRIATGGGFSTRERYTVDDEVLFSAMRPIIFNSIDRIAHRHDLLDRCITVELEPISDKDRLLERELWADFERIHPGVLGALCDAVSSALANKDDLKLESMPRMADFAHWIAAAEPALPWEQGEFLLNYCEVRELAVRKALDSDTVASTIVKLVDNTENWSGSATELLKVLEEQDPDAAKRSPQWPKDPSSLKKRLNRIKAFLREAGIELNDGVREAGTGKRLIELVKKQEQPVTG